MKMLYYRFFCCYILICIVKSCVTTETTCTDFKYNTGNAQIDLDYITELLQPITEIIPVYNDATVPNAGELIEQFQLGKANADIDLNFTQLVTKYGYPVEQHQVTTEDEYCLTMYRIPKPEAPVVFLMHGLLCSSDDWITTGPKLSLAYALADAGYDVWLGNARGNKHSRCHLKYSPDCAEFWQFSFDQIGRYDIPAMIDYVLDVTEKSQLAYVGHSQGNTAFYVMTSEKPEYNEKISIMVCLSAVVFMSHVRSPLLQLLGPYISEIKLVFELLGLYEFSPRQEFLNAVTSTFCGSPELAEIFCESFLFFASGYNYPQLNTTILPVIYSHYPAGSSVFQLVHYGQEIISGKFRNYDFGYLENLIKYKSSDPPDYPLEKVTCPMAIFYSNNDWLTSAPDILKFLKKVENVVEFYHVPCASYMHFDFIYGRNSHILVNQEILRLLNIYNIE